MFHFIKNMHTVLVRIKIYYVDGLSFRAYFENLDICWGGKASGESSVQVATTNDICLVKY
jgi:hypothetical protein